jgi:hypothetical protein
MLLYEVNISYSILDSFLPLSIFSNIVGNISCILMGFFYLLIELKSNYSLIYYFTVFDIFFIICL